MQSLVRAPEQQNERESASLSFALWCAAFFAGIDPFDGSDESGLLDVLIAGGEKRVIPATVVELVEKARPLKSTVALRLIRRTGAYTQVTLEPYEPLGETLMELFKNSGVCGDPAVRDQLCDPDVTFDTLFKLASEAGYNLYIRIYNGFHTIPSNSFSLVHPNLYELYRYRLRAVIGTVKGA
jgi:hypothetical protein